MSKRHLLFAALLLLLPTAAFATHVPGSSEKVEYDGTLAPGVAATGTIGWSAPIDGYDWYCFDVTKGTKVTVALTRKSGDIVLNVGMKKGVVDSGTVADLGALVDETSNSTTPDVSKDFTPDFDGPVTIWVSTFLNEKQGDFSVTMTGGTARASCSTVVVGPSTQLGIVVPDEVVMGNSSTVTVPLTVNTAAGFNSPVAISVSGLPEDVQTSLSKPILAAPGFGASNLTITTSAVTQAGTYAVSVFASGGTATAFNSFLVTVFCDPPIILASNQPKSSSVGRGATTRLDVTSNGTGPFTYQWYSGHSGQTTFRLPGATDRSFTTSAINDLTEYWVRVSNACGSADSQTAVVKVTGTGATTPTRKAGAGH